jgi:hypothetical protein
MSDSSRYTPPTDTLFPAMPDSVDGAVQPELAITGNAAA